MSDKEKDLILLFVVIAVLIVILPVLMWGLWGAWGGHMQGMGGMMGYGWGFMSLLPFAFLVLLVLGAYYLLKEFTSAERAPPSQGERALAILKERYARGEITREEYMKMKEELES
jgi:putative membrane protein